MNRRKSEAFSLALRLIAQTKIKLTRVLKSTDLEESERTAYFEALSNLLQEKEKLKTIIKEGKRKVLSEQAKLLTRELNNENLTSKYVPNEKTDIISLMNVSPTILGMKTKT